MEWIARAIHGSSAAMSPGIRSADGWPMDSIDRIIRRNGFFLRRRDLLALGYTDRNIGATLDAKRIFRVRHGWYSVPDAPPEAIRAVRVGGRLTGTSAFAAYGLRVPHRPLTVAVRVTASRLRNDIDRRVRLGRSARIRVLWIDNPTLGGNRWRVSLEDALLAVLITESRDIAVACCSAALHNRKLTARRLDAVFARAPDRVQGWRSLVSSVDEAHGETFFRLWTMDAGISCEQQVIVAGVGRFDFRIGVRSYVEIDGGQHDPSWTGDGHSTWESDLDRGTTMAIQGDRVLRFGYRQLYTDWPRVLAAVERLIADDLALSAYRRRHPYRPHTSRKRRRSTPQVLP